MHLHSDSGDRLAQRADCPRTDRSNVRCKNHLGQAADGVVDGNRLGIKHVQRRSRQMPRLQRGQQGIGIDQVTPSHVDQHTSPGHLAQGGRVDDPPGLRRRRTMQRHNLRLLQQLRQGNRLGPGAANGARGEEWIGHQHLGPERQQSLHNFPPDAAVAHHADNGITQGSHPGNPRRQTPFAPRDQQVIRDNLPGLGQDKRQGLIGDFVDAVVGNIADGNAPFLRRLKVDVIDADAIPHDDPGPPHGLNDRTLERGELGEHEVGVGDHGQQRLDGLGLKTLQRATRRREQGLLHFEIWERKVGHDGARHEILGVCRERRGSRASDANQSDSNRPHSSMPGRFGQLPKSAEDFLGGAGGGLPRLD